MERRTFLAALAAARPAHWTIGRMRRQPAFAPSPDAPVVNLADYGADATGASVVNGPFQAALKALGSAGGTLVVPPGRYLVDAEASLDLPSGLVLACAPGALLVAAPSASANTAILRVRNRTGVRIVGGHLVGEREGHKGTTGEWGMGVDIRGSDQVEVVGTTVERCWGDGFYVGVAPGGPGPAGECRGIVLRGCRALGNRRQGLSVCGAIGVVVEDGEFRDTGGTRPSAGIDLEPNPGSVVRDVTIMGCTLAGNAGPGLQSAKDVAGALVVANSLADNRQAAILWARAREGRIIANEIATAGAPAIQLLLGASGNRVTGNRITARGIAAAAAIAAAADAGPGNVLAPNAVTVLP